MSRSQTCRTMFSAVLCCRFVRHSVSLSLPYFLQLLRCNESVVDCRAWHELSGRGEMRIFFYTYFPFHLAALAFPILWHTVTSYDVTCRTGVWTVLFAETVLVNRGGL